MNYTTTKHKYVFNYYFRHQHRDNHDPNNKNNESDRVPVCGSDEHGYGDAHDEEKDNTYRTRLMMMVIMRWR